MVLFVRMIIIAVNMTLHNNIFHSNSYSAFFLTVAIGNCMVKLLPPVNFCSDENIQTIFGTKLEDFFKLSDSLQFNILNC
jgi:hypothetical protein